MQTFEFPNVKRAIFQGLKTAFIIVLVWATFSLFVFPAILGYLLKDDYVASEPCTLNSNISQVPLSDQIIRLKTAYITECSLALDRDEYGMSQPAKLQIAADLKEFMPLQHSKQERPIRLGQIFIEVIGFQKKELVPRRAFSLYEQRISKIDQMGKILETKNMHVYRKKANSNDRFDHYIRIAPSTFSDASDVYVSTNPAVLDKLIVECKFANAPNTCRVRNVRFSDKIYYSYEFNLGHFLQVEEMDIRIKKFLDLAFHSRN